MVKSINCVLSKKDGSNNVQKGECNYDFGGYFIISGNEKVIVSQERIVKMNQWYLIINESLSF